MPLTKSAATADLIWHEYHTHKISVSIAKRYIWIEIAPVLFILQLKKKKSQIVSFILIGAQASCGQKSGSVGWWSDLAQKFYGTTLLSPLHACHLWRDVPVSMRSSAPVSYFSVPSREQVRRQVYKNAIIACKTLLEVFEVVPCNIDVQMVMEKLIQEHIISIWC